MKIIISLLLLLAGFLPHSDYYSEDLTDAQRARYALFEHFEKNNRVVYPGCYGGDYLSDDKETLIINITSDTDYFDFLLSEFDCVELRYVKYSAYELSAFSDSFREMIERDFPEIDTFNSIPDDGESNCVSIQLTDEILNDEDIMNRLMGYFDGQPVVFEGLIVVTPL